MADPRPFTEVRTPSGSGVLVAGRFRPNGNNVAMAAVIGDGFTVTRMSTGTYAIKTTGKCSAVISCVPVLVSTTDEGIVRKPAGGGTIDGDGLGTATVTYLASNGAGDFAPADLAANANTWIEFLMFVTDLGQG